MKSMLRGRVERKSTAKRVNGSVRYRGRDEAKKAWARDKKPTKFIKAKDGSSCALRGRWG